MHAVKKAPRKERPVLISGLAAQVLGHSRVAGTADFTSRQMTMAFPAFNEFEMTHAFSELVDRRLVTQKGRQERAVYSLTDTGRTGHVGVY